MVVQAGGVRPAGGIDTGTFVRWRNSGLWLGGRWCKSASALGLALYLDHEHARRRALDVRERLHVACGRPARRRPGGRGDIAGLTSGRLRWELRPVGDHHGQPFAVLQVGDGFNRRVPNSVWYQSPIGPGSVPGSSTGPRAARRTMHDGAPDLPSTVKPSLWSVGLNYTLGGLYAGVGYEHHGDYITAAARNMGTAGLPATAGAGRIRLGRERHRQRHQLGVPRLHSDRHGHHERHQQRRQQRREHQPALHVRLRALDRQLLRVDQYKIDYGNNPGGTIATGNGNLTELRRNAYRLDAAYELGRTPSACSTRAGTTCAAASPATAFPSTAARRP